MGRDQSSIHTGGAGPAPARSEDAGSGDDSVDDAMLSELASIFDDGPPGALMKIFEDFLVSVDSQLVEIEVSLANGRPDLAGGVAHRLRGAVCTFGARRLQRLTEALEQACGEAGGLSAGQLLREARAESEVFQRILMSHLLAMHGDEADDDT